MMRWQLLVNIGKTAVTPRSAAVVGFGVVEAPCWPGLVLLNEMLVLLAIKLSG